MEKTTVAGRGFNADVVATTDDHVGTDAGPARSFETLPELDQHALFRAFLNDILRRLGPSMQDADRVELTTTLTYPDAAIQESRLVPEPRATTLQKDTVRLRLSNVFMTGTTELTRYEIVVTQAETTTQAYADRLRQQAREDAVTLSTETLSDRQQQIVQAAIEDNTSHSQCLDGTPPEPYAALIERLFNTSDGLGDVESPTKYVIVDGTLYITDYRVAVA